MARKEEAERFRDIAAQDVDPDRAALKKEAQQIKLIQTTLKSKEKMHRDFLEKKLVGMNYFQRKALGFEDGNIVRNRREAFNSILPLKAKLNARLGVIASELERTDN